MSLQRLLVFLRQILGFGAVPALSILTTLAVLPLIADRFGPSGWTSIILGQSIGAFASVLVGLNWFTVGPHLIAVNSPWGRRELYQLSVRQRAIAWLALLLPLAGASLVAREHVAVVIATAASASLAGLGASWFFAGTGQPWALVRLEAIPRLLGNLVAIPLLVLVPNMFLIAACTGASALASIWFCWLHVTRNKSSDVAGEVVIIDAKQLYEGRKTALAGRFALASSSYALVAVVAVTSPPTVAAYSGIYRVTRTIFNGLQPLTQALVVPASRSLASNVSRGALVPILATLALLPTVTLPLMLILPQATDFLFSGNLRIGTIDAFLAGSTVATLTGAYILTTIGLVPIGAVRSGYRGQVVAAIVAVLSVGLGAHFFGLRGALAAGAAVGLCECLFYVVSILRARPIVS